MTVERLLEMHRETCDSAREIMRSKNNDYTGGEKSGGDRFKNFRTCEMLGVSAEKGIMIRVLDKMARIQTFIDNGKLEVKSESVDDAIKDCVNYFILLQGVISERVNQT